MLTGIGICIGAEASSIRNPQVPQNRNDGGTSLPHDGQRRIPVAAAGGAKPGENPGTPGGGPIGCELGQVFARFGSQVTLLHRGPRILSRDSAEAAQVLHDSLIRDGMRIVVDVKIERGLAPATGFVESAEDIVPVSQEPASGPLSTIAAATQEAQMLYELTQDLGNLMSLQEALAFVGVLGSGLLISGISTYLTELITGVVLVAAVVADRFRKSRT